MWGSDLGENLRLRMIMKNDQDVVELVDNPHKIMNILPISEYFM